MPVSGELEIVKCSFCMRTFLIAQGFQALFIHEVRPFMGAQDVMLVDVRTQLRNDFAPLPDLSRISEG